MNYFYIYLIVLLVMTIVTLFAYYYDKRKAIKGKWRTKEKSLLLLSFLFGSIGGLIGLYLIRHKNKHWYFILVNWGSLLLHIALGYFLYTIYAIRYD